MSDNAPRLLIDTSVFIQAHRTYYAFHLCPGFWNSMVWFHGKGRVISLDKVHGEIVAGKEADALKTWANSSQCFSPCEDSETVYWYAKMQEWAQAQEQFFIGAKADFARTPDAWIAAYAKAKNLTLVHQETYEPKIKREIKIPNVCKAKEFQINEMTVFEMLEHLGIQFQFNP